MFRTSSQYKVQRLLGRGAYGEAYLVRNATRSNEFYVVKTVRRERFEEIAGDNEDLIKKYERMALHEAELLQEITHSNIVKVFSSFTENRAIHIVMEYCSSGTLSDAIKAKKLELLNFSEQEIGDWTAQIVLALEFLHGRKILHRDVKSDNVFLVDNKEIVKLGDFGTAKSLEENSSAVTKTFIGTPTHMSPELMSGQAYSFKTEIWSLGVLVYELTALKLPFTFPPGTNIFSAANIIRTYPIPSLPRSYSEKLRDLVERHLLVRNIDQRSSIADVVTHPFLESSIAIYRQISTSFNPQFHDIKPVNEERLAQLQKELEDAEKEKAELRKLYRTTMAANVGFQELILELNSKLETTASATINEATKESEQRLAELLKASERKLDQAREKISVLEKELALIKRDSPQAIDDNLDLADNNPSANLEHSEDNNSQISSPSTSPSVNSPTNPNCHQLRTLLLIGSTGTGKSSIVNLLCGKDLCAVVDKVGSIEQTPQKVRSNELNLNIIDTAGFDDSDNNATMKRKISEALCAAKDGVHIIMFVMALGRLSHFDYAVFQSMLRFFGEDLAKNLILVITRATDDIVADEQLAGNWVIDECSASGPASLRFRTMTTQCSTRMAFIDNRPKSSNAKREKLYQATRELSRENLLRAIDELRCSDLKLLMPLAVKNVATSYEEKLPKARQSEQDVLKQLIQACATHEAIEASYLAEYQFAKQKLDEAKRNGKRTEECEKLLRAIEEKLQLHNVSGERKKYDMQAILDSLEETRIQLEQRMDRQISDAINSQIDQFLESAFVLTSKGNKRQCAVQ